VSPSPAEVTIQKSALGSLTKLGRGGQATVYKLSSPPPLPGAEGQYVYKQYRAKILNESGHSLANTMPQLILHAAGMTEEDQKLVRRHTVWPQGLVVENGTAQGILMKLIPDPFFFDLQLGGSGTSSRTLLELQYIMVPESKKPQRGIPSATAKDRLYLILDVLKIVDFLHRNGLVIGDFSPKNLVLSNPSKGVASSGRKFTPKLLDVDAFRFTGGVPPIQQLHTPNWFPPEVRAAARLRDVLVARKASQVEISRARAHANIQTTKSDIFKLGLLVLRLLHIPKDPNEDDTQSVYISESANTNIARLVNPQRARLLRSMLDTDPSSRPSARDVLAAFSPR
jgi:serine/threonine protein kinase